MPKLPSCLIALLLIVLLTPFQARGEFMLVGNDTPVDTVTQQIERYIADHPKDAHGHYLLGRVHSLAWAAEGNQVRLVAGKGEQGLPGFAPYDSVRISRDAAKPADAAAIKHLEQSVASYRKAVELDPKNGLYHLGLAWMLEQQLATKASAPSTQPADHAKPLQEVIDLYIKAFDLSLAADIKSNHRIMAGDAFVSAEACDDAVRLLKLSDKPDQKTIDRLEEGKQKVFAKGMAVTPIVIAMDGGQSLPDLIDNSAAVKFDLSGIASGHTWPWVTPHAGILVWDPHATGQITSSRQMFGTMTWQMLFRDGYEALSMLDRNGDHHLSGSELDGIAVWQDANGNAISDAGEVTPVSQAGITSIDLQFITAAGVLQNVTGIMWRDGTRTASFDWVPQSK